MDLPLKKIFDCKSGNSEITESAVYNSIISELQKYRVLSSSTEDSTQMGEISVSELKSDKGLFEDKWGILIARNGTYAGLMALLSPGKYIITDHAYILHLKKDYHKVIDCDEESFLKWFIVRFQYLVNQYCTKNDNSTFNKTAFFNYGVLNTPDIKEINKYTKIYNNLHSLRKKLESEIELIDSILAKKMLFDEFEIEYVLVNKVLSYISRNDSLSEEGLYNYEKKFSKEKIRVLSGSIDNIYYGEIPLEDNDIHFLKNSQCLHVITRGKAGKLSYVPKDNYATNTNAYLLFLNDDVKTDLNILNEEDEQYYLKFLKIYLEPMFLEISSKSDLGVFPLTNVFESMEIPEFKLNKRIRHIVDKYSKLETIKLSLQKQISQIKFLSEKEFL